MAVFKEFIRDSYVVVDLETTGLSPFYDKIIEIAAVKVTDGKPVPLSLTPGPASAAR